jgi:hypothetical protein
MSSVVTDVFSTELEIRLSFVKTSEFRGGGGLNTPNHPSVRHYITVYQYSEINVMHFLFSLLTVKSLYIFRALLAHPDEALHKRHLVYCVRVMSFGFTNPGAAN